MNHAKGLITTIGAILALNTWYCIEMSVTLLIIDPHDLIYSASGG